MAKVAELPGSMLRVSTPRARIRRRRMQPFAGVGAEPGEVEDAVGVGAAVGVGIGDLGAPAGVHEDGGAVIDAAVPPLVVAEIVDGDDGVGVGAGAAGDVDDHGGQHQLVSGELGGVAAVRVEVGRGVDVGAGVLVDFPALHVVAIGRDGRGGEADGLLARSVGRKVLTQGVGEVELAVPSVAGAAFVGGSREDAGDGEQRRGGQSGGGEQRGTSGHRAAGARLVIGGLGRLWRKFGAHGVSSS